MVKPQCNSSYASPNMLCAAVPPNGDTEFEQLALLKEQEHTTQGVEHHLLHVHSSHWAAERIIPPEALSM
jgi:hypothetical protein